MRWLGWFDSITHVDYFAKSLIPRKHPASLSVMMLVLMTVGSTETVILEFPREKLCNVASWTLWSVLH